jgi:hypothetical protein
LEIVALIFYLFVGAGPDYANLGRPAYANVVLSHLAKGEAGKPDSGLNAGHFSGAFQERIQRAVMVPSDKAKIVVAAFGAERVTKRGKCTLHVEDEARRQISSALWQEASYQEFHRRIRFLVEGPKFLLHRRRDFPRNVSHRTPFQVAISLQRFDDLLRKVMPGEPQHCCLAENRFGFPAIIVRVPRIFPPLDMPPVRSEDNVVFPQ